MNNPTKLISAEEWLKQYNEDQRNYFNDGTPRKLKHSTGDYVRAIQLNALRAAAAVCDSLADKQHTNNEYESGRYNAYLKAELAILSIAERVEKGEGV